MNDYGYEGKVKYLKVLVKMIPKCMPSMELLGHMVDLSLVF